MPMEEEPIVGAIYEDPDGLSFEILALNEDDGTIEIQYEDGSVDEIDIDSWYEMELRPLKTADWKESDADADEEEEEKEKEKKRPVDDDEDDDFDDYDEDDDYEDE